MSKVLEIIPIEEDRMKRQCNVLNSADVESTINDDSLICLHKKYNFPNDLIAVAPKKSDRACSPPSGYLTIYEMNLHGGLRFPPPPELISLTLIHGVSISQLTHRAMVIIMGLIVLFRESKAILTPEMFARICKLTYDTKSRVTCRSKSLEMQTRELPKNWVRKFFFVKNEWDLLEKWGKLKEQPLPLHVQEEDVLRSLNMQGIQDLQFKVLFLHKFVTEESLFKVGLSIQPGRSDAQMLKKSMKITEKPKQMTPQKRLSLVDESLSAKKKGKIDSSSFDEEDLIAHFPEDVLNHSCLGHHNTKSLLSKFVQVAKDWNLEFVKVKYLFTEYKKRYNAKAKEFFELEDQLAGCRTELSTLATSLSFQRQEADRARDELVDARSDTNDAIKSLKSSKEQILSLQEENQLLRDQLALKENLMDKSAVIEEFKNSYDFKMIIYKQVEEARNQLFETEVKGLENQSLEEGFIRGFFKGIRLVHRTAGAKIDGLSPSQVSEDPTPQDIEDDADSIIPALNDSDGEIDIM